MNQATGVRPFDSWRCETPLDCASLDLLRPQRSVADIGDAWVERTYGLPPLDAPPPADGGAPSRVVIRPLPRIAATGSATQQRRTSWPHHLRP